MSPANGGNGRDAAEPGDRSALEARIRRALQAQADEVNADGLRVQPMSELDELARRRQRSRWLLPVAVAATAAAVALLGIVVPQLLDGPEPTRTAATGSASNTEAESDAKTSLSTLSQSNEPPPSSPPPLPVTSPEVPPGPAVQGPRGLVVTLPTGWVQQSAPASGNDTCLRPTETPTTNGQTSCDKGVQISAVEPDKEIEELVNHNCAGPTGTVGNLTSDTRPAAGTVADYREFTVDCAGIKVQKAVWFLRTSQVAVIASGPVAKDPVTQKIVNSIDLSDYAALAPSDSSADPSPTGPSTLDPSDVAAREAVHRDRVIDLGYTPTTVTVDAAYSISCVVGSDANGRYTVLFFIDDVYVGMDAVKPSTSVSTALLGDTQASVTYSLSDGTTTTVVFSWDGTTLATDVAIPPTAGDSPTGPYR